MLKIPTIFLRTANKGPVTTTVNPSCRWVLNGEGTPFRKYNGICMWCDHHGRWWVRRQLRAGARTGEFFIAVSTDPDTGTVIGWVPITNSRYLPALQEALFARTMSNFWPQGTYELCGPSINGNPEKFSNHVLIDHELAEEIEDVITLTYQGLRGWLACHTYEGIVWTHPDGRRAKLKEKDF